MSKLEGIKKLVDDLTYSVAGYYADAFEEEWNKGPKTYERLEELRDTFLKRAERDNEDFLQDVLSETEMYINDYETDIMEEGV